MHSDHVWLVPINPMHYTRYDTCIYVVSVKIEFCSYLGWIGIGTEHRCCQNMVRLETECRSVFLAADNHMYTNGFRIWRKREYKFVTISTTHDPKYVRIYRIYESASVTHAKACCYIKNISNTYYTHIHTIDSISIACGTGDCKLECNGFTSCSQFGSMWVRKNNENDDENNGLFWDRWRIIIWVISGY